MKVDVIINVFGKPWQTLATLKTLLKHSGQHIDKIFMIKEVKQLNDENIDFIFKHIPNLEVFTPRDYIFTIHNLDYKNENQRFNVRYQYGIERSDKKFVFITHNDVFYSGDIIGHMLDVIGDCVGVGEIGQCWNCPAKAAGVCSGDKFYEWNPTYDDILKLKVPHIRTSLGNINKNNPKPMPECRLNEFACLLNREIIINECQPNGPCPLFGQHGMDSGDLWFRYMHFKGYKFVDNRKYYDHGYWATDAGMATQRNYELYKKAEIVAKNYLKENFNL